MSFIRYFTALSLAILTGCGSGDNDSSNSDMEGDIQYRATITTLWNAASFATQYPDGAHWSPPIGASHNKQVIFWRKNSQAASNGIEVIAESGGAEAFIDEIKTAKDIGYSQAHIQANSIGSGSGSTSVEFSTSDAYPLFTMASMIAPSPDWFIGVDSLSLKENNEWLDKIEVQLPLYDAGTDLGLSFNSSNSDSSEQSLPISLLSTARTDSDFESGVHFQSGDYVAKLVGLFTFVAARFYRIPYRALLIFDAMGLSLFAITGSQIALSYHVPPVIAVMMGVMSGAVGGIIRDVLANEIPLIFRKEIYATAAIVGSLVYVNLDTFIPQYHEINALLGMCTVFIIRMAAIKYSLSMPVFMFADAAREEQDKK